MSDCLNGDLRDLLPDLAAERLSGAERARVASHVASCAACAAEVELLHAARRVMSRGVPAVDIARIVAALPKPPVPAERDPALVSSLSTGGRGAATSGRATRPMNQPARGGSPRRYAPQWSGWRVAAVAMIAVGGLSLAVLRNLAPTTVTHPVAAPRGASGSAPAPEVAPATPVATAPPSMAAGPQPAGQAAVLPAETASDNGAAADAGPGLAVASDISELSDGDVEALLRDMNGFEGQPSADPDAAMPSLPGAVSP
jgi:hypothetical protein